MVPFEDPRLERALSHVAGEMSFDVTEHDVVCGPLRPLRLRSVRG